MSVSREFLIESCQNGILLLEELKNYFGYKLVPSKSSFNKIDPLYPPMVHLNLLKIVMLKIDGFIKKVSHGDEINFSNEIPMSTQIPRYWYNNGDPFEYFFKDSKYCNDLPYQEGYWNYGRADLEQELRERFNAFDFEVFFKKYFDQVSGVLSKIEKSNDNSFDSYLEQLLKIKVNCLNELNDIGKEIYKSCYWYY